MAFAISLKATNDTADLIRELWEELAQLESRPPMVALDYLPHLTLAVYDAPCQNLLWSRSQELFELLEKRKSDVESLSARVTP